MAVIKIMEQEKKTPTTKPKYETIAEGGYEVFIERAGNIEEFEGIEKTGLMFRIRDDVDPRIGTGRGTDDAGPVGQMRRAKRVGLKKIEGEGLTILYKIGIVFTILPTMVLMIILMDMIFMTVNVFVLPIMLFLVILLLPWGKSELIFKAYEEK